MKNLAVVPLTTLLVCAFALADTIDNPGDFNLAFDAGMLKIGRLDPVPIDQLTIAGSVDGDGNVTIPAKGIVLPDYVVSTEFGNVTVRFIPLADGAGTLIPATGEATAMVSIRIGLSDEQHLLPPACGIGPINAMLTTGSDGDFTGVPYSTDDGTATYVDGTFAVPASDGCGFFAGIVDTQVGLPSLSGNNWVDGLHGNFDTIFTGS